MMMKEMILENLLKVSKNGIDKMEDLNDFNAFYNEIFNESATEDKLIYLHEDKNFNNLINIVQSIYKK